MQKLAIVTTGGTIDKIYFDDKSTFQIGAPQIGEILEALGVAFEFDVVPLLRKDSLHIDAADRELIRKTVEAQAPRHVLVTHGTDTMVETARALAGIPGKVIVLTGALDPALFRGSDAVFNIGCAVGAVQTLADGVHIAMNGRIVAMRAPAAHITVRQATFRNRRAFIESADWSRLDVRPQGFRRHSWQPR